MIKKAAVFFDRDDTLIRNIPYLGDPAKVRLMPYAVKALEMLKTYEFELFIISNQSGVGRGLITEKQVHSVNAELLKKLGKTFFTDIYCCYAAPDTPEASCRKPSPAMVFQARDDYDLDLSRSFFVGNQLSDVLCAHNAGCRSVLIPTEPVTVKLVKALKLADHVAKNLLQAANLICS